MIKRLIVSFILTIVIEGSVSFIIGIRSKEDLKVVFWVNALTNPVVVFIANCLLLLRNELVLNIIVFIMEVIVIFVEYYFYKLLLNYKKKSPLMISSLNNITSFFLGMIISNIIF